MKLSYFIYIWLVILKFNKSEKNESDIHTSFRLPNTVIPVKYRLIVWSGMQENYFRHKSTVKIHVRCIKPTNKITLHSRNLNIKHIELIDIKHGQVTVQKHELEPKYDFLHIYLNGDLIQNTSYRLEINFTGKIEQSMSGYYRMSYKDKSGQTKWISSTQFQPTHARAAFPCFDEAALRAKFTISLGHQKHLTAISNMPIKSSWADKNDQWHTFKESVKMPTYLVAYSLNDFGFETTLKTNSYGNTTINIWAQKNALKQVEFALEISPRFLSFYEEYFDIAYPLPKSDMLAIPDFATRAMENWGLITFRESQLLYVPGSTTEFDKYNIANTVAHEIAHYWFGDLVTIKWWSYLWLKEGFATYLARIAARNLLPELNIFYKTELISDMQSVYAVDALQSSRPVSKPIDDPDRINEIKDDITYSKGNCIIRMMVLFLGNEVLKKGLTHYLKKYKYDSTEPDDLWNSLTLVANDSESLPENISVNTIMDTWTTQAGYPLVTVVRDYIDDLVTVTQVRFLENVNKFDDSCYWVPLSYTTKEENNFTSTKPKWWLPCPEQNITFELNKSSSNSWIIFNIKTSALCRVNYDKNNWKMLIDQLESDYTKIGASNRALLVDDVMKLAMTGHVDFKIAFDLIKYIRHENSSIVWSRALQSLFIISDRLDQTSNYGLMMNYMNQLVNPKLEEFCGFNCPNKLSELQLLIVSASCSIENRKCEDEATAMFEKWKQSNGKFIIPSQLRYIVYCQGLKNGYASDWDYLWQTYLKSNVATEKDMILDALGCTRKQWLLIRYLNWIIENDSGIRHQDARKVLSSVIRTKEGSYVAREFFYDNIQKIYDIQSPKGSEMRYYLLMVANSLRKEKEFNEFAEIMNQNEEYFKMAQITRMLILEKFDILRYWYKHFYPEIVKVLKMKKKKASLV